MSAPKHDILCQHPPAPRAVVFSRGFFFRGGRLLPIESFDFHVHQDVAKIATKTDGESAYVNNFLFFPAESLPKVRHLIDGR